MKPFVKISCVTNLQFYSDNLNFWGVPFEIGDDGNALYIVIENIKPSDIHNIATLFLPLQDIDAPEFGTDLYIKHSETSKKLIDALENTALLSSFISQIDGQKWYDLPFCKNPTARRR